MRAQRVTMTFAGLLILASLVLAHFTGQAELFNISWLWFTVFVGVNLTQADITGFCPMTKNFKATGAK